MKEVKKERPVITEKEKADILAGLREKVKSGQIVKK